MFNIHVIEGKEKKNSEFGCVDFSQSLMSVMFFFTSKCEESFILLGVKVFKFEAEQDEFPKRTCSVKYLSVTCV